MPLEEFHGPYTSWTQISPTGDTTGSADTNNIQKAFNTVTRGSGPVVYLASGNFYINKTLTMGIGSAAATVGVIGPSVLGNSHLNTTMKWVGTAPAGVGASNSAIMFKHNGVTQMRLGRITFDGSGTANVGIMDAWDNSANYFPTANRYEDIYFKNLNPNTSGATGYQSETLGLALGELGFGSSETSIFRCAFDYTGNAFGSGPDVVGAMTYNFNSLDNWFWDCEFKGPQMGVCNWNDNSNASGDFCVQRSAFQVTQRDLAFANLAPNFSSRWNYSSNAGWRHVEAAAVGNFTSDLTVQGCTIAGGTAGLVTLSNAGPIGFIDNKCGPHGAGDSAALTAECPFGGDNSSGEVWSIGNQFKDTLAGAFFTDAHTQLHTVDDTFAVNFTDPGFPAMTTEPALTTRTVHEPSTTTLAAVQTAINAAAANDVIHIPFGTYTGSTTVTVPANKVLWIEGDGQNNSVLQWNGAGAGPVIQFMMPSLAFMRNIHIDGNGAADCVGIDTGTSNGGVIHMESCNNSNAATTGGLRANNLGATVVDALSCQFQVNPSSSTAYGASSENGSTVHWVCGTSGNGLGPMFQVLSNGTLVACNIYAENGSRTTTVVAPNCNGVLNIDGGRVVGSSVVCNLSSFTGTPTFTNYFLAEGGPGTITLGNNCLFLGCSFPQTTAYSVGSATQYAVLCPRQDQGSGASDQTLQIAEATAGISDMNGYIRSHLAALRSVKPVALQASVAAGNTQLVLINVVTNNERIAFNFSGSGVSSPPGSAIFFPWM